MAAEGPFAWDDAPSVDDGAVTTDRDLRLRTGRRRSDRLQLMLLMGLPHEVRRGLSVISLLAEGAGGSGPEIVAETRRLDLLISTIADVARVVSHGADLDLEQVRPDALIADAVTAFRQGPDGAAVPADVPAHLPSVLASAPLAERILVNLLTNAAQHGAPPVTITVRAVDAFVEIAVTDEGPGMPDGILDSPAPLLRRASPGGWRGVGLAVSRLFAEEMGGGLELEPSDGGCRVVFRLRVAA